MRRQQLLLVVWVMVVMGLAVHALAAALLADDGGAPVRVTPLRLDLNTAGILELELLPGVGRVRAEAIVLDRVRHGPFGRLADLDRVDGFGQVTIAGLAPFLHCDPPRRTVADGR